MEVDYKGNSHVTLHHDVVHSRFLIRKNIDDCEEQTQALQMLLETQHILGRLEMVLLLTPTT